MRHNAAMKKVSIRDLPMRPGAVAQEAAEGEVIIVEKRGSRWRIYFDSAYLVKRYIWDKDSKKAVNLAQAVENGVFFRTVHRRSIACFVPRGSRKNRYARTIGRHMLLAARFGIAGRSVSYYEKRSLDSLSRLRLPCADHLRRTHPGAREISLERPSRRAGRRGTGR
jgi:hypothetical protein